MKTPFPPQEEHINFLCAILRTNGGAADTSETGCGKTLCGIQVAKRMRLRPFICAPKASLINWKRECEDQQVEPLAIINYEKLRTGRTQWATKNRSNQFTFNLPPGSMIIFDEGHACKAFYTLNAKLMLASAKFHTLVLSATASEHPGEMRSLGFVLRLHKLFNFIEWAKNRGCVESAWGSGLEFDGTSERGMRGLNLLNREIYPLKGHRMLKSDLAQFFKGEQIIADPIDFGKNEEIARIMLEVEDELDHIAGVEEAEKEKLKGNPAEALVRLLRARQRVEMLKVPVVIEMIQQALTDHKSVPVFLNFNDTIRALSERLTELGIAHGIIWGEPDIHNKKRQEYVDAFNCDKLRVLLLNSAAGGTAINLHHTERSQHQRESLISPSFKAKEMHQIFGRIHRAGEQTEAIQRILVAGGTVEERVLKKVLQKISNMEVLHEKRESVITTPTPMTAPTQEDKRVVYTEPNPPGSNNTTTTTYAAPGTTVPPGATVVDENAPAPTAPAPKKTRSPAQPRKRPEDPLVPAAAEVVETVVAPVAEPVAATVVTSTPAKSEPTTIVAAPVAAEVVEVTVTLDDPSDPVQDRPHAPFSPSSLEWRSHCPGYTGRKEKDGEVNEAAASGTRCHKAAETRNLEGLDDEEAVLVEMVVGYEDEICIGSKEVLREIEVRIFDQWGFLDTLIVMPDGSAHIIDFKFGRLMVRDANLNLQMKAYTLGVMEKFPDIHTITVHLVLPRLETISIATFTRADHYNAIAQEIFLVIEQAKWASEQWHQPAILIPVLRPFCESCDYCGNLGRCPAMRAQVLTIVSKHHGFELPDNINVTPGEVRHPDELGVLRRAAEIAEKWSSEVKSYTLELALTNEIIPTGYNLQAANSPRSISNTVLATEVLVDAEGKRPENERLTQVEVSACSKGLSIGDLERIFAEKAPARQKAKWKEKLGSILADAGAVNSGGTYHKLVPINKK